jgi:hypothetical protein
MIDSEVASKSLFSNYPLNCVLMVKNGFPDETEENTMGHKFVKLDNLFLENFKQLSSFYRTNKLLDKHYYWVKRKGVGYNIYHYF